jgi:hypothetical protein
MIAGQDVLAVDKPATAKVLITVSNLEETLLVGVLLIAMEIKPALVINDVCRFIT